MPIAELAAQFWLGSDSEGSQLKPDKPSRTAVASAAARAAHLHIYEGAPIHTDDFALARLEELQLSTPGVIYVPVDFGCEDLEQRLVESGIKLDQPTFFSWLGVTQYIDRTANDATLSFIASQPRGSEVVFTFIVTNNLLAVQDRAFSEAAAHQSSARGEPWITYFDPTELEEHLADLGFDTVERLTPQLAGR